MTIYTTFLYNKYGYADFLRGAFSIFVFCKLNNIENKIYIPNHNLNKCIECLTDKLDYPMKGFVYYGVNPSVEMLVNELNKCKNPEYNVIIYTNFFDYVSFDILKKYIKEFKDFLKLKPIVKERIENLKQTCSEYTAIHIRCGDKFIECENLSHNSICIDPRDNKLFINLEKIIEYLKEKYNLPICIFTDVKSLKNKICNKYNLIGFNTEIHHITAFSNNEYAFIDTLAEFELLGNSKEIVKMTNTGFVYWTAFINEVPLFIYNIEKNTIDPYIKLKY